MISPRARRLAAIVALSAAAALYFALRAAPPERGLERARVAGGKPRALDRERADREAPIAPPPTATLANIARSDRTTPSDGTELEPPIDPEHPELFHAHPITPERVALAEQHAMFEAIENALAERDVARARQHLAEHRRRFTGGPGDFREPWQDRREGYEIIADCIEHPGAESRARAEHFIDAEGASTVRRRVRHACLGPQSPALLPPR